MNDFYDGYGADQNNWRQPNRNGITADGGYDPQFDFEDRAYPVSRGVQSFQNNRDFQPGYQQAYGYDFVDAGDNLGPLDLRTAQYVDQSDSGYQRDSGYQKIQYRGDSGDRVQRQQDGSGDWSDNQLAAYRSLVKVTNNLDQRSLKEFDPSIDPDVGCARAVSLAVSQAYGINVNEVNVNRLETRLRGLGFQEVNSTRDIKPGDVILAYRPNQDYSHSAIYMGNGMIFNNDSETQLMRQQSINKFNSAEFNKFVVLRRPDTPLGTGSDAAPPVRRTEQPVRRSEAPVRQDQPAPGSGAGAVTVRRDSSNRVKW